MPRSEKLVVADQLFIAMKGKDVVRKPSFPKDPHTRDKKNSTFASIMLIKEEALTNWIDNFYGYGSWRARFWFISHEETGGEIPEDVADKINYFATMELQPEGTLCDIRDLYRHVEARWESSNSFNSLYDYRFDSNAKQNGIWKNLILFANGYQQTNPPDLLEYQKHHFLSTSTQNEVLIPLYPLPGPNTHAWYYTWLDLPQLAFLKSRKLYEEHVYQRRIQTILSNISKYKPEVVLMYGMDNINTLKESIQAFFDAKFKMVKAEKQIIPQHHRADFNGTTILITTQLPALRHQRPETGFDWEAFGSRTKEG